MNPDESNSISSPGIPASVDQAELLARLKAAAAATPAPRQETQTWPSDDERAFFDKFGIYPSTYGVARFRETGYWFCPDNPDADAAFAEDWAADPGYRGGVDPGQVEHWHRTGAYFCDPSLCDCAAARTSNEDQADDSTAQPSGDYADWDDDDAQQEPMDTLYAAGMPLVRSGSLVTIFGPPTAGKSWLCALWAAQVVRDGDHVVWIDYERQRAELRHRLMDVLGLDRDELARVHYVDGHREPDLDAISNDVWDWHTDGAKVLVVVDAFSGLHTVHGGRGNQNDADTVEKTQTVVRRFQPDATVCLIDHTNLSGEPRGSGRKVEGVDVAFVLRQPVPFAKGKAGRSELTVLKERGGELLKGAKVGVLDYDGERFELLGADRSPEDRCRELALGQMRRKLDRVPGINDRDLRNAVDSRYRSQVTAELIAEARDAA